MTPSEHRTSRWSVVPWERWDAEPPDGTAGTVQLDGRTWELREPLAPAWKEQHVRRGACVHDSRRAITYRATVDAAGEIDHLEVVLAGPFRPDALVKLTSVPIMAIQREVNLLLIAQAEAGPGVLVFTAEGGTEGAEGDGSPYSPPTSQQLLDLLTEHPGWGRSEIAAHYGRNVRTVDRWLREARRDPDIGHLMPPVTRTDTPKEKNR